MSFIKSILTEDEAESLMVTTMINETPNGKIEEFEDLSSSFGDNMCDILSESIDVLHKNL